MGATSSSVCTPTHSGGTTTGATAGRTTGKGIADDDDDDDAPDAEDEDEDEDDDYRIHHHTPGEVSLSQLHGAPPGTQGDDQVQYRQAIAKVLKRETLFHN